MLTREQERRVIEAMAETQRHLDREMVYMPQHRDEKQIAFCTGHIAKLASMLSAE